MLAALTLVASLALVAADGGNAECALIVANGPANTCVTFEAVNAAFTQASQLVGLPPPANPFSHDDVANLGTVLFETTRILAQQFNLPRDAIANGLPLLDTSRTIIASHCPSFIKTPVCRAERYRRIGGVCNNLEHPHWGAADHGHHRFLNPAFEDGIASPRVSVTGQPLPSPRLVSYTAHRDQQEFDHAVTIQLTFWGQTMDHDLTLTAENRDPETLKTPDCCNGSKHRSCFPIEIPKNDPFYTNHRQECLNFARSVPGLQADCRLGPRTSYNLVAPPLDAGVVYGDNDKAATSLRAFKDGLLKALPIFADKGMKDLLPLKLDEPDDGCVRPREDVYCFNAGDLRANENTAIHMVHLFLVREHNRIAKEMKKINPHWNDETLYQETRHIIAAIVQHITFNEFLPMLLGRQNMEKHDLILLKEGYSSGYDPKVNPSADIGFTTAAMRMGHTLLPSTLEQWSSSHKFIGSKPLSDVLMQPFDVYKAGFVDTMIMGLVNKPAMAYDDSVTREVTNHLFREPGKKFGMDLISLNLQRGREHGVPPYPKWREWCGLSPIRHWDDLIGVMTNHTVNAYRSVYATWEDIDLWSAGVSEVPLPGSLVGPTFACILGRQFSNVKHGDRFWYENGGWPSSFTLEQLAEIRRVKWSRIICDNGDHIESVQVFAMVMPDHEINPRVPCGSGILPRIDLTKWRDASFHSGPSEFQNIPF